MMLKYLLKRLDVHRTNEEFQSCCSCFLYFSCFIDGCAGSFMLEGCGILMGPLFTLVVPILVALLMYLVEFVPLKAADSVVSACISEDVSDRVKV